VKTRKQTKTGESILLYEEWLRPQHLVHVIIRVTNQLESFYKVNRILVMVKFALEQAKNAQRGSELMIGHLNA
jgi:hypothetical protein